MDLFISHTSHGIWLVLLLSMPVVLLAAAIGLVIGILQAVTQVQEQTISAAPKLALVFLFLILGGPTMMQVLQDYTIESVRLGTEVIPAETAMVLPPEDRRDKMFGDMTRESKEKFFKEPPRAPSANKNKSVFQNPSNAYGGGKSITGPAIKTKVSPTPKMGVGEKIYTKRRQDGNLPKPPQ